MESPGPPIGALRNGKGGKGGKGSKGTPVKGMSDSEPVPLSPPLFAAMLEVCIRSARVEAAIKYFEMVAEDEKFKDVIDHGHMTQVMKAFAMRRIPKGQTADAREAVSALSWMLRERRPNPSGVNEGRLDPRSEHFIYALTTAWKAADMASALHIFERMTKISPATYTKLGSGSGDIPIRLSFLPMRYHGCPWNVTCMALLVKTADATQRVENMRIAMRILRHTNMFWYFFDTEGKGENRAPVQAKFMEAQKELASRTIRVLDALLAHTDTNPNPDSELDSVEVEGLKRWVEMKKIVEARLHKIETLEIHRAEDQAREEELKKSGLVRVGAGVGAKDAQARMLVGLKGRSAWAKNL